MSFLLALSLLAPVSGYQAASATPATPAPVMASGRRSSDQNQIICRREREPGHRTVIRRTCMTRREWADYRRELRQNVDRAQMTRVHAAH